MSGHIDEQRLLALGLGEPPSASEAEHLAGCPACAAVPAADAQLWSQLKRLQPAAPAPSFSAGALARFRAARGVRHRPREIVLGGMLVAALVVVLCLWGLRLVPGALVTLAVSVPRWSSVLAAGNGLGRVLVAVFPVLALSSALLLGGVGLMLRRLTTAPAK